jgi:hypothetical protein
MKNSSKFVVTKKDGTRQTIGLYMRGLANNLNLLSQEKKTTNDYMRQLSDLYQEKGIHAVNDFYESESKELIKNQKVNK